MQGASAASAFVATFIGQRLRVEERARAPQVRWPATNFQPGSEGSHARPAFRGRLDPVAYHTVRESGRTARLGPNLRSTQRRLRVNTAREAERPGPSNANGKRER